MGLSVCLSVKSNLTSGASVHPENTVMYSAGNGGRKICGDFSETAPFQRYAASCVVGYCSDIPCTFSTAEPSKGPKKANDRLNSTWSTTRCKVASFFLFGLHLLPKVFHIVSVNVIRMVRIDNRSSACAFKDSRMRVRRGFCTLVHSFLFLLRDIVQ